MTDMAKPVPKEICAYCGDYTFKYRPKPFGWAYCKFWKKFFPDQKTGQPAGMRTCPNFK